MTSFCVSKHCCLSQWWWLESSLPPIVWWAPQQVHEVSSHPFLKQEECAHPSMTKINYGASGSLDPLEHEHEHCGFRLSCVVESTSHSSSFVVKLGLFSGLHPTLTSLFSLLPSLLWLSLMYPRKHLISCSTKGSLHALKKDAEGLRDVATWPLTHTWENGRHALKLREVCSKY